MGFLLQEEIMSELFGKNDENISKRNILKDDFNWQDGSVWKQSAINTTWCLVGCSIGDFGTIYYFQITSHSFPIIIVMLLAIINGIITSIILLSPYLLKQRLFKKLLIKII